MQLTRKCAEADVKKYGQRNEDWPVWTSALLCTFFPHRRSKLYNGAAEDSSHSHISAHRFAQTGLRRASAMHETRDYLARPTVDERPNLSSVSSETLNSSGSKHSFSWGIPGICLAFLLLAWLFLL
ncbi:MAG: hypothetical protein ABR907_10370 [Terracidiphilus sp.]|jgi:hypothetical protein